MGAGLTWIRTPNDCYRRTWGGYGWDRPPSNRAELLELGLTPGSESLLPVERMEAIRLALEKSHGTLPTPTTPQT
jgi:hypothetical protein